MKITKKDLAFIGRLVRAYSKKDKTLRGGMRFSKEIIEEQIIDYIKTVDPEYSLDRLSDEAKADYAKQLEAKLRILAHDTNKISAPSRTAYRIIADDLFDYWNEIKPSGQKDKKDKKEQHEFFLRSELIRAVRTATNDFEDKKRQQIDNIRKLYDWPNDPVGWKKASETAKTKPPQIMTYKYIADYPDQYRGTSGNTKAERASIIKTIEASKPDAELRNTYANKFFPEPPTPKSRATATWTIDRQLLPPLGSPEPELLPPIVTPITPPPKLSMRRDTSFDLSGLTREQLLAELNRRTAEEAARGLADVKEEDDEVRAAPSQLEVAIAVMQQIPVAGETADRELAEVKGGPVTPEPIKMSAEEKNIANFNRAIEKGQEKGIDGEVLALRIAAKNNISMPGGGAGFSAIERVIEYLDSAGDNDQLNKGFRLKELEKIIKEVKPIAEPIAEAPRTPTKEELAAARAAAKAKADEDARIEKEEEAAKRMAVKAAKRLKPVRPVAEEDDDEELRRMRQQKIEIYDKVNDYLPISPSRETRKFSRKRDDTRLIFMMDTFMRTISADIPKIKNKARREEQEADVKFLKQAIDRAMQKYLVNYDETYERPTEYIDATDTEKQQLVKAVINHEKKPTEENRQAYIDIVDKIFERQNEKEAKMKATKEFSDEVGRTSDIMTRIMEGDMSAIDSLGSRIPALSNILQTLRGEPRTEGQGVFRDMELTMKASKRSKGKGYDNAIRSLRLQ